MFVIASFCITVALAVEIVIGESQVPAHGAVASLSGICSDLGVGILKKNGNAVDAAITTMLCSMVVEPHASGLGGGGFIIIHDHNSKTHPTTALDFRETVPEDIQTSSDLPDRNVMNFMDKERGLRVGVPGELLGMRKAHSLHGHLPWIELFVPVIKLAEAGFPVSPTLAKILRQKVNKEHPASFYDKFVNPATQQLYQAGEKMHRQDLANLFTKIIKYGVSIFYNGSIAEEIVNEVQRNGGVMKLSDLSKYTVIERHPLIGKFQNYTVIAMPAPSSGSLLLYTLNNIERINTETPLSSDYLARLTKITRKAYHCRSLLGDPLKNTHVLLNEKMIANKTLLEEVDICENLPEQAQVEDHGTAHVSVIDKDEMLVSFTSTLNSYFGSKILTPSGILLNDEMKDFSNTDQILDQYNFIQPFMRPLSSMVPAIVYQHSRPCFLRMSAGGVNGTRTFSSVVQTIINMVKFGMDPKEAVESPKIFCDNTSCEIETFDGVENVVESIKSQTGIQTIRIVEEKLAGVGVISKAKTDIKSYFEPQFGGKTSQY